MRKIVPDLVRTKDQLREAIEHVSRYDYVVVDVETTSLRHQDNEVLWVGLGVADRSFLIPLGHPTGPILVKEHKKKMLPPVEERRVLNNGQLSEAKKEYTIPAVYGDVGEQLRPDIAFEMLYPLLTSDRLKIGANIKFDVMSVAKYLRPNGGPMVGPFHDITVLVHVHDENYLSYGLKEITLDRFLQIPAHNKAKRAKAYPKLAKGGIADKPMDEVARYLAKDLRYTLLLHNRYLRQVSKIPTLLAAYNLEMELYPVLIAMEEKGVRIDIAAFQERGDVLKKEIGELTEDARKMCGNDYYELSNLNKKREYLFSPPPHGRGLIPFTFTPTSTTDKPIPQLDRKALEYFAETKGDDLAKIYFDWSLKDKLYKTFVVGLMGHLVGDRLHTSYKQHATVTGRLSSAEPNLQQIPREDMMKSGFIADPDHVFVVADYSQIELRCAAFLSQDPEMIQVFLDGLDIHTEAAASMMGIVADLVTSEQRHIGKTQNFGTLYGASVQKIATVAHCSEERAQEFIDKYYKRFAGLNKWKARVLKEARATSEPGSRWPPYTEIPPYGRRRRLSYLYANNRGDKARAERQAINAKVQGFAAYIMKMAMIDLYSKIYGSNMHLILNVHDELVLQVPIGEVDAARELMRTSMEGVQWDGQPIIGRVPLIADIGVGRSWKEGK